MLSIVLTYIFVPSQLRLQLQNKTTEVEEDSDFQWPCSWRYHLRKVIIDKFEGNDDVKETIVDFFLKNEIMVETISNL
jgi:hypothetical protein